MEKQETPKELASSPGVMTIVFTLFLLSGVLSAAYTGRLREVSDASFQSAKDSVTLALGLIGVMAFWLGMMRVLEAADQAGISRRYGGIHFKAGDLVGRTTGAQVGDAVWDRGFEFIDGTVSGSVE